MIAVNDLSWWRLQIYSHVDIALCLGAHASLATKGCSSTTLPELTTRGHLEPICPNRLAGYSFMSLNVGYENIKIQDLLSLSGLDVTLA